MFYAEWGVGGACLSLLHLTSVTSLHPGVAHIRTLFSIFLLAILLLALTHQQQKSLSLCVFQIRRRVTPAHPPRGLSSLLHLSLWTTRDLLTKIAKKNTFHRSFLSRCLHASAIFQLPYDHSEHEHSCQQKTRKQESPCESDLTEDRFVTSLQVENRSPTAQKGTGHFSTLIPEASSSYMK